MTNPIHASVRDASHLESESSGVRQKISGAEFFLDAEGAVAFACAGKSSHESTHEQVFAPGLPDGVQPPARAFGSAANVATKSLSGKCDKSWRSCKEGGWEKTIRVM
ncbi:MAG TPA: hypothetical protein PK490_13800 [Prosthecobacter sp.]|nr:hypothetical protein [Prosthecobacter sp.]HRK15349.1 hypothetical protein [Prosthecobacter sp.]